MSRDDVEKAIRAGIHDSYRYGVGFAIATIEKYQQNTTDPDTFTELLTYLRTYSAGLWKADQQ